jgi:hypothetical protein
MGNLSDWSAVSGIISGSIDLFHFVKEHIPNTSSPEKKVLPTPVSISIQEEQEQIEPYRIQLGRRHKSLRENILQLNPREMASFYDFEETEKLEKCEAGLEEFPTKAMKKLEDFFFVDPKYLQEGGNVIFHSFFNDKCKRFVNDGFRPYFLCGPNFEADGLAFLIFCKEDEGGYWRMIGSTDHAGFRSSGGGGAHIIYNLIDSMLDPDMSFFRPKTLCLDVSAEEWEKLRNGRWYNKGMRRCCGTANNEATDIYERRFLRAQRRAHAQE